MSQNEEFPSLDATSIAILAELQRDARQTIQQLAAAVGASATPVWRRIKEMEASGVIRGYSALVDREKVGLRLAVVVECNLETHTEEAVQRFEAAVNATPAIVRCLATTGQSDYIMTVLVAGIKDYERLLHEALFRLPGIEHVRSSIVLKEVKVDERLPVDAQAARAGKR